MSFASEYLSSRVLYPPFISSDPDKDTGIIVIIPAFDEPGICRVLDSLLLCTRPACGVEVIVHLNAASGASDEELRRTLDSEKLISEWNGNNNPFFSLFCINTLNNKSRDRGAGMARKVVMDEALYRFNTTGNAGGVILSLDADCSVSENYLVSVYSELLLHRERKACSLAFEHPVSGSEFDSEVYSAITAYELHLRYYYQALKYSGFPHVFHTVGSAFAVKALPYAAAGGMNRKQAGEDFYFIQKLIPMGGYFYLDSATVYPSPRISGRVPFGTGPLIRSMLEQGDTTMYTYNPLAFSALGELFKSIPAIYDGESAALREAEKHFKAPLVKFLEDEDWHKRMLEIRSNTSSRESFIKRFNNWFNMFKVVKFLNRVHSDGSYKKEPVELAAKKLLKTIGEPDCDYDMPGLLNKYRSLEH
ncbi:MAG: glycosyltransferase family 2 protein [Marinilabiliaceae bacterium]|jgi:hypothetical protein|nr:glycosyltransferase family 2 protein [Marinilabiliaceae bacterium]